MKLRFFVAVSAALISLCAHSAIVTVGSLTRDTTQDFISDSVNNRTWLGWDVTKGLTYAQTVAAIGSGGQFEGFSIAQNADAQLYVEALLSSSVFCTASGNGYCKFYEDNNVELVNGESGFNGIGGIDVDLVYFLSNNGVGDEVGYMFGYTFLDPADSDYLYKNNEGGMTIAQADQRGIVANDQIGYLLFRSDVPEPSTLVLVAIALACAYRSYSRSRLVRRASAIEPSATHIFV